MFSYLPVNEPEISALENHCSSSPDFPKIVEVEHPGDDVAEFVFDHPGFGGDFVLKGNDVI
jgi:hypothetical protein